MSSDTLHEQLHFEICRTEFCGEDIDHGTVFTPVMKSQEIMFEVCKEIAKKTRQGQFITILEPSSGIGNLIWALFNNLKTLNADFRQLRIHSNELNKSLLLQQKKRFAHSNFKSLNISYTNKDYLFATKFDSIDYVLMNPPWLGYKQIPFSIRDRIKSTFDVSGQFDILDAFVIKATLETRIGGKLCLFLPDKVLSTQVKGTSLNILGNKLKREKIVHLDDKFFQNVNHASVYLEFSRCDSIGSQKSSFTTKEGTRISDLFTMFRGVEISGRNSEWITNNRFEALSPSRRFLTGNDIGARDHNPARYLKRNIPKHLLKSHFSYEGPAILARKTGTPVEFSLVDKLPFFSQVVFALIPRDANVNFRKIFEYLKSNEAQLQIAEISGKQHRKLFPYVTLSVLEQIVIPDSIAQLKSKKAA